MRARQVVLLDSDFDNTRGNPDNFAHVRTSLSVRAKATGNAQAFVELPDSRAFGEESGTTTTPAQLEAHQAYMDLGRIFHKSAFGFDLCGEAAWQFSRAPDRLDTSRAVASVV